MPGGAGASSRATAPWHVVPADHKWFARVVIGSAIVTALEKLDLKFPKADPASLAEFKLVRKALLAEDEGKKVAVKKVAVKKAAKKIAAFFTHLQEGNYAPLKLDFRKLNLILVEKVQFDCHVWPSGPADPRPFQDG